MARWKILLLAVALLVLSSTARAHGNDNESPYDPRVLDLTLLLSEGAMTEEAPAEGAVYFRPGEANAPHPPLEFTYVAPSRLALEGDVTLRFLLAMDRPVALQDKDGGSFEVSLAHNHEILGSTTQRIRVSAPTTGILGTSTGTVQAEAKMSLGSLALANADTLTVLIRPLMPVLPPDALKIVVGKPSSSLHLPLVRVPTLADMGLQDAPMQEFLLSDAPDLRSSATTFYYELRVDHARIEMPTREEAAGRKAFLVLRGVEGTADAHAHHEFGDDDRRRGAAHHFQVGKTLVRVHPGVGVVVPLVPGGDGLSTTVSCMLHCPEQGYLRTLHLITPDGPEGATGGTLIPPPRNPAGVPVSEDAPEDEEEDKRLLPSPGAAALLAILAAVAAACDRSRRQKP